MARFADYAVLRFEAHPARDERLNVGLVVFDEAGLDVRLARKFDKVRAISAALDVELFRENLLSLSEIDRQLSAGQRLSAAERRDAIVSLGLANLSKVERFAYISVSSYEAAISRLLELVVEPEPALVRSSMKRTKLLSLIKRALKSERVLGKAGDDLSSHQVIPEFALADGLIADFVLKNGAFHVVETVDASDDASSPMKAVKEVALSALKFEQARIAFETEEVKPRLVYAASPAVERMAKASLMAVEHQGAELVNWQSAEDRTRLIVKLSELAVPTEEVGRKSSPRFVTSNQARLKLN